MDRCTRCAFAATLVAGAVSFADAGRANPADVRTFGPAAAGGGDGGEVQCEIRKVTPNWTPECPGEQGDTLGLLALTANGEEVVYSSWSTFCLPGAENMFGHIQQIIVRNTKTQEGELISVAYDPQPGESISGNATSEWYPHISPNGRYVAFASMATNLVSQDVSGEFFQVYVRDRHEQVTYLASRSTDGEVANDWGSDTRLAVSNDGKVAFASRANNLHPDQPQTKWAVYVHDVHTGVTELVSRDENGHSAASDAFAPAISADGTTVAFASVAPLVSGLAHPTRGIYVRDLVNNVTEIVSVDADGQNRPNVFLASAPRISDDGNHIVFRYDKQAASLDPTFPPGWFEVLYVRDRANNVTRAINRTLDGQASTLNPESSFTISGDGKYVAWNTIEGMIVKEPVAPHIWHVYRTNVNTLESDLVTRDVFCQPIPDGHDQMFAAISGDGNTVVFNSMWHVMYDDDFDWARHLYTWTDPNAQPECGLGDLNCDGAVDGADLLLLLAGWGECQDGDVCAGDLNGDGKVDGGDLLILLANWG